MTAITHPGGCCLSRVDIASSTQPEPVRGHAQAGRHDKDDLKSGHRACRCSATAGLQARPQVRVVQVTGHGLGLGYGQVCFRLR